MPPASRGRFFNARQYQFSWSYGRHVSSMPRPPRTQLQRPKQKLRELREVPDVESQHAAHRRPRRFIPQWLRDRPVLRDYILVASVVGSVAAYLLSHFPFDAFRVLGGSMRPTINPDCTSNNDTDYSPTWVMIWKWEDFRRYQKNIREMKSKGTNFHDKYTRGDIVVYKTPHDPNSIAVKRVVGVAGDTVVPLKGYAGGEEPVIVPFNHIWVEGDVNDRKHSVDSNYFGPISVNLVTGRVVAMWSPWWHILGARRVDSEDKTYPAKLQGRVAEDAVHDASVEPRQLDKLAPYKGEKGKRTLQFLKTQAHIVEERFRTDEQYRIQTYKIWEYGLTVARGSPDPETKRQAIEIVGELQRILGKDALRSLGQTRQYRKEKRKWKSEAAPSDVEDDSKPSLVVSEARTDVRTQQEIPTPAKVALQEMLEKKRQLVELRDKEREDRLREREARDLR